MRNELNENELVNVDGGKIEHTWSNGSGTITLVARTPQTYSFTNYSIIQWISDKQNEGWSDYEIIDYLRDKGHIW